MTSYVIYGVVATRKLTDHAKTRRMSVTGSRPTLPDLVAPATAAENVRITQIGTGDRSGFLSLLHLIQLGLDIGADLDFAVGQGGLELGDASGGDARFLEAKRL
jgi:hypothetical protein